MFRLYGNEGCPYCEQAAQFLLQRQLPVQFVAVGDDPILQEGIKRVLKSEQVLVPALVSFLTGEVISGFKEGEYKRVADHFNAQRRVSLPNDASNEGGSAGPTAPPVEPLVVSTQAT